MMRPLDLRRRKKPMTLQRLLEASQKGYLKVYLTEAQNGEVMDLLVAQTQWPPDVKWREVPPMRWGGLELEVRG